MDDIIAEFLAETNEGLAQLDNDLVRLEQEPENDELISRIFRVLHTIKGTCGFIGLTRLEKVAHKGEDVLGLFRDKKLEVTPAYVTLILECLDCIKAIVQGIETTGQEPEGDDSDLIKRLEAVMNGGEPDSAAPYVPADIPADVHIEEAEKELPKAAAPQTPKESPLPEHSEASDQHAPAGVAASPQSLRINVDVLENMMTMVSELVLTRNQLLQIARQQQDAEFQIPLQHLNHVVSDLQEEVMKTRMQPIGNAWAKLPRIIRDVSKELGKDIELEMHGQETELDRQILDMIKDPLTHMVRNSADHGIEMPEERVAKGKPPKGKVTLTAYHQGGHIHIVISDDGKGLPLDKIRKKILQNQLATEEQLAAMTPQQIQQYIFHAGFSTAEAVTSVSGRGVGMDVVRSNIEKIGGSIEMISVEGKGTTFTIKIPLTLAIVSALIVKVGNQRLAIPQLSVSELVLVSPNSENRIETIDNSSVLRLRGNLLPLVSLAELLGVESPNLDTRYVVVTKVGSTSFGLIVDHVFDLEEIVIKPLSRVLKGLSFFSGNTILGDGCVIMILDPAGILKTAGMKETADNALDERNAASEQQKREQLLLLFRAGDETMKATPIEMVSRLEEIDISKIEYSDGKPVIQYLGHLMPLHNFDRHSTEKKRRPLIILRNEGRSVGLLADQILDVARYYGDLAVEGHDEVCDSIILNDIATDVINARMIAAHGVIIHEEGNAHG